MSLMPTGLGKKMSSDEEKAWERYWDEREAREEEVSKTVAQYLFWNASAAELQAALRMCSCGGDADACIDPGYTGADKTAFYIQCKLCKHTTPKVYSEAEAIAAWNQQNKH